MFTRAQFSFFAVWSGVVFRVASRFHVCACFAIGCFVLFLPWLKNSNVVVCWLRAVARVCRLTALSLCSFCFLFI